MMPMILYVGKGFSLARDRFSRIFVRFRTENIKETMDFLQKTWREVQPNKPFTFYFQDEAVERMYNKEKQWSSIVRYSSLLSIIIACLGIFGLTAVTLSCRVKEIGVRKLVGSPKT